VDARRYFEPHFSPFRDDSAEFRESRMDLAIFTPRMWQYPRAIVVLKFAAVISGQSP